MFRKQKVFAEIVSEGVYALFGGKFKFYKDITSFLKDIPKRAEVFLALGRDTILLQKVTLPKDAKNYLEESAEYAADDVFPGWRNYLVVKPFVIKENTTLEILIVGVRKELYENLLSLKQLKLLTLSSFILASYFENGVVYNKVGEELYEKIIASEGKVIDVFLVKNPKENKKLVNPEEFLKIFSREISKKKEQEFFIIYRIKKRNYINILIYLYFLFSILFGAVQLYEYKRKSEKLEKLNLEIKRLLPYYEKYTKLVNDIYKLKKELKLLKNYRSNSLEVLYVLTNLLPKDTWIELYIYTPDYVILEGYTSSTVKLVRLLRKSKYFENVTLENIPLRREGSERFRIRLLFKKTVVKEEKSDIIKEEIKKEVE